MRIKIDEVELNSNNHTLLEYNRAIDDLLYVYWHPKMYINEKNYTTKLIAIFYSIGYYKDIESIFIKRKEK